MCSHFPLKLESCSHNSDYWFSLLNDIHPQFTAGTIANISHGMNDTGWDKEHIPRLKCDRRLAVNQVLQQALEDINDFLAGVRVSWETSPHIKVDTILDRFMPWDANVVALEICSRNTGLLLRATKANCECKANGSQRRVARWFHCD
jgi:hypothetical protein